MNFVHVVHINILITVLLWCTLLNSLTVNKLQSYTFTTRMKCESKSYAMMQYDADQNPARII